MTNPLNQFFSYNIKNVIQFETNVSLQFFKIGGNLRKDLATQNISL